MGCSFVYFVRCKNRIKIGVTRDVKKRIAQLQVGNSEQIKLVFYCQGDKDWEQRLHLEFKEYRVKGEWFRNAGRLSSFAEHLSCLPKVGDKRRYYYVVSSSCDRFSEEVYVNGVCVAIYKGRAVMVPECISEHYDSHIVGPHRFLSR